MSTTLAPGAFLADVLRRRIDAGERFFQPEAPRLARLCHRMAARFARGGRLFACGVTPADRSDARHVAVEFVHPVIVGKRALPALGLTPDGGPLTTQVDLLLEPSDILMAFGEGSAALCEAVRLGRERGALTVAFADLGAEWQFPSPDDDAFVRQELVETLYHVIWELVHVFFEHGGLLGERTGGAPERPAREDGAAGFLYPFLGAAGTDLESVLEDVRRSVLMKTEEVTELRRLMLDRYGEALLAAARALRTRLDAGGRVLAFGNGGSATDAMDAVADLRAPPRSWPARRAVDLTEDAAILSALANDIGPDGLFARQVIAYGREGDVALAFSTSGDSRNVIRALEEAAGRGIYTIAFLGYDGGRIAADGLADVVVVAPSQHIPRIQEAHATAWHLLRELIELPPGGARSR